MPCSTINCLQRLYQTCNKNFVSRLLLQKRTIYPDQDCKYYHMELKIYTPIRVSTALVAVTCDPSMASSRNRSMGSQSDEELAPWEWQVADIIVPEAKTAWKSCCDIVFPSRVSNLRVSDVNSKRTTGVMCFKLRKADEFAESNLNRWSKPPQCDGLKKGVHM